MFSPRTDLAVEVNERYMKEKAPEGKIDGIETFSEEKEGIKTDRIKITNASGSEALGKPVGSYITIEAPNIRFDNEVFENVCHEIGTEIRKLTDFSDSDTALVIGLGNRAITPDALGHEVISHIMVTNHIKTHRPELLDSNFRAVCAVAPGVLGTTGIESADIIKALCEKTRPKLVIVADALAAADFGRICTTFQICDTGIAPGAGVGNNRNEINERTLGVKVIAIGVPTMIDARSIANENSDTFEKCADLMVTPRDIDALIKKTGMAIAYGINIALHKYLTLSEINEYVG